MVNEIVQTLIVAMFPIGELRVALPLALTKFELSLPVAFLVSVVGNMIPVVIVVYFLEPVSNFLIKHSKFFKWFFEWLFHRTRKKHSKRFETLEEIALVTFVAIPLPATGAWTGALAAFLFGIPPKKSIPLIGLGVVIAGVIVTILTLGIQALF